MLTSRVCHAALFFAVSLGSQDFRSTLAGTITDPAGAAVSGAKVKAVNTQTNAASEVTSNENGRYSISFLIPGQYVVTVEANGFKQHVRQNLELQISASAGLNVRLELGALTEKVTVSGQMSLLETETASRGGIVDNELVAGVPNAGRNVFNLAFAMPGVHKPSSSQGTEMNLDGLANARTAINGAASGTNGTESNTDILIDGTSATKGDRQVIMIPALESVQEFRVLTNIFDAQYGRTGGGIITTTTKSGTNQFHGAVFDRYFDGRLAANAWANNRNGVKRPDNTYHNYGFQANGPVWIPKVFDGRNKLFFMVNYDASPTNSLYTTQWTTPLPEMKSGNFANVFAANGQPVVIYDPLSTRAAAGGAFVRTPFAGNRIPANLINPVGAKIVSYYPDPTQAGDGPGRINNFFLASNNRGELWQWTGRMDVRLGSKNAFFGRYGETNMTRCCDQRYPTGSPAEISTILPRGRRGRTLTLDWTRTLNASTTFNLRAGFSRLENLAGNDQTTSFDPTSLGLPASLVSQFSRPQYPQINMGTYQSQGSGPFVQGDDTYTLAASGGKVIATHVMKFGVEARDFRTTNLNFGPASGSFAFSKLWTQADPNRPDALSGNEIASALLGYATSGSLTLPITPAYRARYYSVFFQDDWKISRRLTLNLGLRWDFESPVAERYNQLTRGFAFGQPSPLASQVAGRPGVENCAACRNLTGGLQFAGSQGVSRLAYQPDRNNFQPRIGAAYSLNSKTVLRGGFGVYTLGQWALGTSAGFSRTTPMITTNDNLTPSASMSNPFPGGILRPVGSSLGLATDLGLGVAFGYTNRPLPLSRQVSFGIQRELPFGVFADAAYIGNFTAGLPIGGNINVIPSSELGRAATYYAERVTNPLAGLLPNNSALNGATIPRQNLLVPFPQYAGVGPSDIPAGRNNYNSLQVTVKKRFARGLNLQANYFKGKTLEQLAPLNPQDLSANNLLQPVIEKRLTIFDVSQKLAILGTYELPLGRGKPLLSRMHPLANGLLGNWRLGWNATLQSGFPIDFPNAAPLEARSAKLAASQRSLTRWFDTSLFPRVAGPAPFTLRNFPTRFPDVRFMGVANYDFSLSKDIVIRERVKTQVRADFINAFNRPYFTQLNGGAPNVTSANFGQLNPAQNNSPRVVYLEFRLTF
ncbi:MAG: carboxypeptidase-like regulatory domain-containing protein [Bryobacteraceae bacterium]|nr:carboxypeptidase-like regulatory domain-containing protein [Bryobacteraceae bacterium]